MTDSGTPGPELRAVQDEPAEPDQVPRLLAFRAAHPEVTVELDGFWNAKIAANGETIVRRYELRDVLDELARLLGDWQQP
jgi:DNA-binding transcriptional LysR family regulator